MTRSKNISKASEIVAGILDGKIAEGISKVAEALDGLDDSVSRKPFVHDGVTFTPLDADIDEYGDGVTIRYFAEGRGMASIRRAVASRFEPFPCHTGDYDCCGRAFRAWTPDIQWVRTGNACAIIVDRIARDV